MKKDTRMNSDNNISDDNINILEAVSRYLQYWKLIVAIVLAFLLVGVCYIFVTSKKYQASASILLIEESSKAKNATGFDLESIGLLSTTNNIDNEIAALKSPDLMLEVVKNLDLNKTYYIKDKLRDIDIYKDSPYSVSVSNDSLLDLFFIKFSITQEDSKFRVEGEYKNYGTKEKFGILHNFESLPAQFDIQGTNIIISKVPEVPETIKDKYSEVFVKIENPVSVADGYAYLLNVSTVTKYASTLSMDITSSNPQKGKDILTELIRVYNVDNVKEKSKTAQRTSAFINERIASISVELGDVEKDVEAYKQTQGITDLTSEAKLYMEQTALNNEKLIEVNTQIKIVSLIEEFIKDSDNNESAIPSIGLEDPGLVTSIAEYNNKLIGYSSVLATTSHSSPTRHRILDELNLSRDNIKSLVKNVKNTMLITKQEIEKELNSNVSKIHSLPSVQRGLIERMRQQQIKEELYLFLLQKREESNITIAATSDKAKTVIRPRDAGFPVAPNKKVILFAFFVFGFFISLAVIYILLSLRNKIESREELEKLAEIPVLGILSRNEEVSNIVISKGAMSPISELFRYLRNRIEFVLDNQSNKNILVTSTVAGEGKTFVALNLACSFALDNKKILLVGMDVRNPQLASVVGFPKGAGFTDYLAGVKNDWKGLLVAPIKDFPNLDILQAGTIPPNPNELLKSKAVKDFLQEVQSEYDYVIIDTAPLGVISDTYELSQYVNFTLYVARENVTHKSAVEFINEQYEDKRFPNMYLVLNDADISSAKSYRYGYAHTYGYQQKK